MIRTGLKYGLMAMAPHLSIGLKAVKVVKKGLKHN